jgi:hypothetical protein
MVSPLFASIYSPFAAPCSAEGPVTMPVDVVQRCATPGGAGGCRNNAAANRRYSDFFAPIGLILPKVRAKGLFLPKSCRRLRAGHTAKTSARSTQIASKSLSANNLTAASQGVRIDELGSWRGRQHALALNDFSYL